MPHNLNIAILFLGELNYGLACGKRVKLELNLNSDMDILRALCGRQLGNNNKWIHLTK